jgi:hypothetical protein
MYDTLEKRLTAAGYRTTKLQLAFDALEFANGNVGEAKRIAAKHGDRISARTWNKAINARIAYLQNAASSKPLEQLTSDVWALQHN